jgi:hypothetical protein
LIARFEGLQSPTQPVQNGRREREKRESVAALKLPYVVGATWDISAVAGTGFRLTAKATAAGEEDVTVPAGKYRAIRVDWAGGHNGKSLKSSIWYAANAVIVKVTVGEQVPELKPFAPGM